MAGGPHPLGGGAAPPARFGDGRCPPRAPRPPAVPCDRRGRLPQSHATGTGVACRAPRGHPLQSHAAGMGGCRAAASRPCAACDFAPPSPCCQQATGPDGIRRRACRSSVPTAAAPWACLFPFSQMDHRQFRGTRTNPTNATMTRRFGLRILRADGGPRAPCAASGRTARAPETRRRMVHGRLSRVLGQH